MRKYTQSVMFDSTYDMVLNDWTSSPHSALTMQVEKCLRIKIFRVQAVSLLPHLLQLVLAALQHESKFTLEKLDH